MSRRRGVVAVLGVAVAAVLTGCSSGTPGDLTAAGAQALQPQVQHVRDVAATGDYIRLQAAVDELKALVRQQQQLGNVTASRAAAIDDAADVLLEAASPSPTPTPTPTTTSPTPTPTTTSPTPTPTPTPSVTTTTSPIFSASAGTGDNGNGNGNRGNGPDEGGAGG